MSKVSKEDEHLVHSITKYRLVYMVKMIKIDRLEAEYNTTQHISVIEITRTK